MHFVFAADINTETDTIIGIFLMQYWSRFCNILSYLSFLLQDENLPKRSNQQTDGPNVQFIGHVFGFASPTNWRIFAFYAKREEK